MASRLSTRVTIDCDVHFLAPNVLAEEPRVPNNTFLIAQGIGVDSSGLVLDEKKAMCSGVDPLVLENANCIQEQSAGTTLCLDERSSPSGSGRFAKVVPGCLKKPTGVSVPVSCKILRIICPSKRTGIAKELQTLLKIGCKHANICPALNIQFHLNRVVVVFPRLDITIHDMCENFKGTLDARARFRVVFFLVKALRFLHNTLNLVHRDVTASNVMLLEEISKENVQLIDFGCAQSIEPVAFSSTAESLVPPALPAFCWGDVSAHPDTDGSPFSTFSDDKTKDDVCALLLLLQWISDFVVDTTQRPARLDLTCTSADSFLEKLCVYYLHKDVTIPGSEELYRIMRERVEKDPQCIEYPGWSLVIEACLAAKARKASS